LRIKKRSREEQLSFLFCFARVLHHQISAPKCSFEFNLGHGKKKNVVILQEKSKIIAFYECGLSFHKIAEKTGRYRKTIPNFIKNKESYGKNYKGANNHVVTTADRRSILRIASNSHDSSAKIRE